MSNIWEKNTADAKHDSPRSATSKMSRITGLNALKPPAFGQNANQSLIQLNSGSNNYTLEELMRRVRRIEKLTDRMSHGQFDSKKLVEKVI